MEGGGGSEESAEVVMAVLQWLKREKRMKDRKREGWRLVLGFGIKPSLIPCKII